MLSFLRHSLEEATLTRQALHFSLVFLDSERAAPFLLHAVQRPTKGADTLTLRFAVAAALFATSTPKELEQEHLSLASRSVLQSTTTRLIQIWTDPIFVQRHTFQEHTCKMTQQYRGRGDHAQWYSRDGQIPRAHCS